MKLICGLGNPGGEYRETRHNAGFLVVEKLTESFGGEWERKEKLKGSVFRGENFLLFKSGVFMNESGRSISKVLSFYKVDFNDLYLVHDDLDIVLGEYKIQKGRGPKDHNGVLSVERELGKKDFWRVRVGVENREERKRVSGEEYVLERFSEQEKKKMGEVVEKVCEDLKGIIGER